MKDSQLQNKKIKKKNNHAKKSLKKVKAKKSEIQVYLTPVILFAIFFSLWLINFLLAAQIVIPSQKKLATMYAPVSYPVFLQNPNFTLTAESAVIIDNASQTVMFAKNPNVRFSMASTTKIMTALVSMEYFKPDDIITVYTNTIEGSRVGLQMGEQIRFEDALYGMMLPSGNDAAYAIAQNYPGGITEFIRQMNAKAHEFNLKNTHFADPAGLNDDQDYTTVVDLARLASQAIKNPKLVAIADTKQKIITSLNYGRVYVLTNLNKLLGVDGVIGLKTGFTEGAGGVLVTVKVEKGRDFIVVVMRSKDRFRDTEMLLKMITNNISYLAPTFLPPSL